MTKIGIYKIISPSNKVYIGQSINIEKRFNYYKKMNCKSQPKLYNSFIKYGIANHQFHIICLCKIEELNIKERYYQEIYDVIGNNGLNCILQQTNSIPKKVSDDTKYKMSVSAQNKIITDEHRNNMSKSKIGRKYSDEAKSNISKSLLGKKHSLERNLKKKGKHSVERNLKKCKKVINIISNIIYNSIKEAATLNNINNVTLCRHLNSKNNKTDFRFY